VLWLAAAVSRELLAFRERVRLAATAVSITTPIGHEFFPHLALGSSGPAGRGDFTLWDVHTVFKRATITSPGIPRRCGRRSAT
jgi:hypothetical protein